MLVVIAVRDAQPGFVQLASPVQFLQIALTLAGGCVRCVWNQGGQHMLGGSGHPFCLQFVGAKALCQPIDHRRAHVLCAFSVDQVVQRTMPERALGGLHFIDLQQVKYRLQDGQPTANDGLAVFLDAFEPKVVRLVGFEQTVFQPGQTFAGDFALRPA